METNTSQNDWLTPQQLQEQYHISVKHQCKLRMRINYEPENAKHIPPIPFTRVGNRVLYNKAKIDEWLLKLDTQKTGLRKGK
ncbi:MULTISPECIES: hypothetical protein [unclassified Campylobacter]|uniref:hypothetical protein n=1 Tax=unclassified Campylobacter TaxID=2593542 RepID=UPI0022E9A588|nr:MULTISPECIES: hypothetical protein [unclassified Campylobacter]MDA3048210.1 hypothetical protein [Campylobacter sp. JMF_08 NE1]MDA3055000.1 hypothetical protein [Campylobacter sp. VBCF_07 NA4]MDA3060502.1 hypothetical protein [Campylobacter sp. VBCF_02 NA5]MDA3070232.1 hypothetical protein [Campylobacter sp. VBCF_08 NA3]WBR54665.1 hypothetical protein PF027_01985 [Campylobacter sp. VBCF_01 NA2]